MNDEQILNRIKNAIILLNDGKRYSIGDLHFNVRRKEILDSKEIDILEVMVYSQCSSLELMTKQYALCELEDIKRALNDLEKLSEEFKLFVQTYIIEYVLSYNYGMGAIGICIQKNDTIEWLYGLE